MHRSCAVLVVALLLCVSPARAGSQRIVQVLGPFEGRPTVAAAINDAGHVAGNGWNAEGETPLLWTPEGGFDQFLGNVTGRAHDINNRGEVVGVLFHPTGTQGFLWSSATGLTDLGMDFYPIQINDAGVVVGSCADGGPSAPCRWRDGTKTFLDSPFPGVALAVNNQGDVTGFITDPHAPSERELPVVWRQGGAIQMLPTPEGTHDAVPYAINERGFMAGFGFLLPGRPHLEVLVWDREGDLAPGPEGIDGVAIAINDAGTVAGISAGLNNTTSRGFSWIAGSDVSFLPGGNASQPTGINARGDIVGVVIVGTTSYAAVWREQPVLRITTPNSPSRWGLNTTQRLGWTYSGDAAQFLLEISRDSGRTWMDLATVPNAPGSSQNFHWTVTGPLTSAAKFRVSATGDPEAIDINDIDVRIANATIEIVTPKETTSVELGSPLTIFYKHSLGARAPVAIEVSPDNGRTWRTLAETTTKGSTTSSFAWIVDILPTRVARVRIRARDGSGAQSAWSRAFTITTGSRRGVGGG